MSRAEPRGEDFFGLPDVPRQDYDTQFYVCRESNDNVDALFSHKFPSPNFLTEAYKKMQEFSKSSDNHPGLFIVRSKTYSPLKYEYLWFLTVSKQQRFFLFPKNTKLTTRSGWIYSISRNCSDGTTRGTEELYKLICTSVVDKICKLKSGWYSINLIFDHISEILTKHNLKPNRSQIISINPALKYLICDDPIVLLKKLKLPKEVKRWNKFPIKWLVEKFSPKEAYRPLLEDVAYRPDVVEASIIDFLNADDPKYRDLMFDYNPHIIDECLVEIGFDSEFVTPLEPKRKSKLMRLALGYNSPRIPYHQHFLKISKDWNASKMIFDLELRVGEVFEIWIESLMEICDIQTKGEFIDLINENSSSHRFNLKEPVDLGSVNLFIDLHLKCMKLNESYGEKIRLKLPERMFTLMTDETRQMLEFLSILRNKLSHAKPREKQPRKYHIPTFEEWNGRIDSENTRNIRSLLEEFYLGFYGVTDDTQVSSVPTLMEVVELSENNRGSRARLQCMRNGTMHHLSITSGGKILAFMDNVGRKRKTMSRDKIQIGDRMYVWATTNPTLVDPIIIKY